MLDWYRELGAAERRTFWACFGGWALDALDVQIYTFVVPALIAVWHITNAQAGLLATSALVISAFGGWIAGMFADRVGRARLLMIMVAWFAFFTFLSGFTQNFEQLLVVRGFQGFGFGGEWAAGSVLIGEVVRGADRGKVVGTVQSAWAWGWGAAAILATIIFQVLPQEIAWRVLFFVGILPALLVFYIRTKVPEPAIFEAAAQAAEAARHVRHFRPRTAADHDPGRRARDRRAGRLLRDHDVSADLPAQRAPSHRARHRWLSRRHHHRLVVRLYRQRLSRRRHRPAQEFLHLRRRLAVDRHRLYADRDFRRDDARAGLSARLLRLGHLSAAWGRC